MRGRGWLVARTKISCEHIVSNHFKHEKGQALLGLGFPIDLADQSSLRAFSSRTRDAHVTYFSTHAVVFSGGGVRMPF
jgi:hypothetical protein